MRRERVRERRGKKRGWKKKVCEERVERRVNCKGSNLIGLRVWGGLWHRIFDI